MANGFDEVYEKIMQEDVQELKKIKSTINKWYIGVFLILAIIDIILSFAVKEKSLITVIIAVSVGIWIMLFIYGYNLYTKRFKNIIVTKMVKEYNPNLSFDATTGNPEYDYKLSEFGKGYDKYSAQDDIHGKISTGEIVNSSEVKTSIITYTTDAEGHKQKQEHETFRGYFAKVSLKQYVDINAKVATNDFLKKYSKSRVEVDSSEFEKYFDLITEDKVKTMEIFTSDVIEKIINIKELYPNSVVELKIDHDNFFLRFGCGDMFEPPKLGMGLKKEQLRKYFMSFYYPMEVLEAVTASINRLIEIGSL